MLRSVTSPDSLQFLVLSATLVASVAILPILLTGYAISGARARRSGPDFALVHLETIELDRALLLYEKVSAQLRQIREEHSALRVGLLTRCRRKLRPQFSEEERSLQAYAGHLRSTIVQLRGAPVRRYRRWMHLKSSQTAFSRCVLLYLMIFALLVVALREHPVWAEEVKSNLDSFFVWKPFDDRLLYANWMAANLAPIGLPMFYCIRRARLWTKHWEALQDLKAFAAADPDTLIPFTRASTEDDEQSSDSPESESFPIQPVEETWFDVLHVPPSADIEEIKTAYKMLIKQNHPDRVHDMAPLFRELAEFETKRINAAYQEALRLIPDAAWAPAY